MGIFRHESIEKDIRNMKRFPAPQESLEAWERLFLTKGLHETPAVEKYPHGFGNFAIYKARVVPLKENRGKSGGYRLIFQLLPEKAMCRILVFSRHGEYGSERELMEKIRERLNG
ncbi:MAG: hypothetical protein HYT94_03825 [Parcubacteria group bacterium]|nr:hypothetical protein [Parcubacteria group bacterium]